ncbi:N(4)-acetylcytidine aminohydrolase [Paraferrimonas sp. SM1919]|uniref:N(4)-acetylcytidine aminohydrolase n=1 Tax=Paraferrimonas sp. SM1919 TaxID=2662263 RepID=UPI0013D49A29|nr:N(4)-acetylcytidine aminohydrolase [Paraferrimonas sp. SM1919]
MKTLLFFDRFEHDIKSASKTITLRDLAESDYHPGELVQLVALESQTNWGQANIKANTQVHFDELTQSHAQQENMTLAELKKLIVEIYPNERQYYCIEFEYLGD